VITDNSRAIDYLAGMAKAKSLSPDIEDLIRRQTECIKGQMERIAAENARIAELEAEIAVFKGGLLHALAAAAVAKINAIPKVGANVVLFDRLEQARLQRAARRLEAKTIDVEPGPAA